MMRFEKIIVSIVVISLILIALHIAGGYTLFLASTTVLSIFYYIFGLPAALNLKGRQIITLAEYKGVGVEVVLMMILSGWGLATVVNGCTFKVLHYAGWQTILFIGFVLEFFMLLLATILYMIKKMKREHCRSVLFRGLIVIGFGVFCYALPWSF